MIRTDIVVVVLYEEPDPLATNAGPVDGLQQSFFGTCDIL